MRVFRLPCWLLIGLAARASAGETPESPATPDGEPARIVVTGTRDAQAARRDAATAKVIIGREEIEKYGEATVGDLLRRLPGVTVSGAPGSPGEVKMRGLSGAYTQILVDGERIGGHGRNRAGPIDLIPAEMIERIEIVRGGVAEFSAQAVAGTINIVLRDDAGRAQTRLRPGLSEVDSHVSPQIGLQNTGRSGGLSWLFSANANQRDQIADQMRHSLDYDDSGALETEALTHREVTQRTRDASLAPRLTWRLDRANQLSLQLFATHTESEAHGDEHTQALFGTPKATTAHEDSSRERDLWRLGGGWRLRWNDGDTLNLRLGLNGNRERSSTLRNEYDAAGSTSSISDNQTTVREQGSSASLRWAAAEGATHTPAIGAEWTDNRRSEQAATLETGAAAISSNDNLEQRELNAAAYLQDEWHPFETTTLTGGLRREVLHTHTQDSAGAPLVARYGLWAPSLQLAQKFGEAGATVLRSSLARTFRAPRLDDLSGLTVRAPDNSLTRPDRSGNPELRPETAWGFELALERYFDAHSMASANLFTRRITDLIRRELTLGADGRWVSRPVNEGQAQVRGAELEWKLNLTSWLPAGPVLQINGNYTHTQTRDDAGNKLEDTPDQIANLGFEWQPAGPGWKLGGNVNWAHSYTVRLSDQQTRSVGDKTVYDAYVSWAMTRDALLRLSGSNLGGWGSSSRTIAETGGQPAADERIKVAGLPTWQLALELKF